MDLKLPPPEEPLEDSAKHYVLLGVSIP